MAKVGGFAVQLGQMSVVTTVRQLDAHIDETSKEVYQKETSPMLGTLGVATCL